MMLRYLEVGRVLNQVSATIPLDGRRRMTNDAAIETYQFSLVTFNILQQLRELWRHDVAWYWRRSGVAEFTQRCG